MTRARKIWEGKPYEAIVIFCPGCNETHHMGANIHKWNGSVSHPTFTPSILWHCPNHKGVENYTCHSFVNDGRIQFLGDSTHALAGQTVELPECPNQEGQ